MSCLELGDNVHAENLKIGSFITVRDWEPREIPSLGLSVESGPQIIRDRSYCGEVLFVLELAFPFVVVYRFSSPTDRKVISLDTREVHVMPVSERYAYLLLGDGADQKISEARAIGTACLEGRV
jgi:hypothetical protein